MSIRLRKNLLQGIIFLLFVLIPITQINWVSFVIFILFGLLFWVKPIRTFFRGTEEAIDDKGLLSSFGINWKIWMMISIITAVVLYLNIDRIESFDSEYRVVRLCLGSLVLGLIGMFTRMQEVKLW